jgi:hypothetical protein
MLIARRSRLALRGWYFFTMSEYPFCEFCGLNDSPPDKEELVAKWIAREFPDAKWSITKFSTGRQFTTQNHFGLTTRKVCRRCNNRWMSDLESKAKQVLAPMIHGNELLLDPNDQLTIAKWAMKSTIVYEIHDDREEYFFNRDDCHRLFASGSMPLNDTAIYLAYFDDPTPGQVRLTETRRKGLPAADERGQFPEIEIYCTTFAIKHFAMQVITLHRAKTFTEPLTFNIPPEWQDASLCIWPVAADVTWPPRLVLNDGDFNHFAKRWGSPDVYMYS